MLASWFFAADTMVVAENINTMKESRDIPMINKRDMLLIGALALVAAGLLLLIPALRPEPAQGAALYLRYSLNGQETATIPLTQERDLTVDQGGGMVNTLHLSPDGFFMASSLALYSVFFTGYS